MTRERRATVAANRQFARGVVVTRQAQTSEARQLQTAIALVLCASADRNWGAEPAVRARLGGRVQLGEGTGTVDAATVFQAARGVIGALLDDLVRVGGYDLEEVVAPWLATLETAETLTSVRTDYDL
jgi:hypothetical protein